MSRPVHRLLQCLFALAMALGAAGAWAGAPAALVLEDSQAEVDVWPAMRVLADPGLQMDLAAARRRLPDFQTPTGPSANLGVRREAVWLHVPLQVTGGDGHWLLEIAYPPLGQADVYLLSNGVQQQQARLGSVQPYASRPLPGRAHTLALTLPPGQAHALYIRVLTESAMVLPIFLQKPVPQQEAEGRRLLLQGLMLGVALALLVYSVAHWLSLREALFGYYALMLAGTTVFFLDLTGLSQQTLAYQRVGLQGLVSPLSVLVALAAGARFVALSLGTRQHSPRLHLGLNALCAGALVGLVLSLLGILDYHASQLWASVMGPLVPLLAIPAAWRRWRQGDIAARYVLAGWCIYTVGAATMSCLLRGWLPATRLTLGLFQWASMVEMLVWLRVLGLYIAALRRHAERTELERTALVSMAHTDPLTGLPNRRGLQQALAAALPACSAHKPLAVFVLDLDGFKAINDRLGHDAGDALLVQVGQRLRAQLRQADRLARLGGDEFVVMAPGIPGEAEALVLGRKLLNAFEQPFNVGGQVCRVGLTIGFALAPQDGSDGHDLLKRADAAMYAGKQAGRHTVRRVGALVAQTG